MAQRAETTVAECSALLPAQSVIRLHFPLISTSMTVARLVNKQTNKISETDCGVVKFDCSQTGNLSYETGQAGAAALEQQVATIYIYPLRQGGPNQMEHELYRCLCNFVYVLCLILSPRLTEQKADGLIFFSKLP